MFASLTHLSAAVIAAVPDPTQGTDPPGAAEFNNILHWLFYGVTLLCVAGVLICAGKMAVQHRHGEAGQHFGAIGMVLGACVLAGSASALVGTFLG